MTDYREIRSDAEYLHGVRLKIHALQYEVNEEQRVRAAKRRWRLVRVRFLFTIGVASIPYWLILPRFLGLQGALYIWCFAMLCAGTVYENFIETRSEFSGYHRA